MFRRALKAGFSPDKIIYSGSNLNAEEMTQLLNWGITAFNLDSIAQFLRHSSPFISDHMRC